MIKFISSGLNTSIQDKGRFGYKRFGITNSGAMDDISLRIVNKLVGNRDFESAIEFTLMGPVIEFKKEAIVAVGGGEVEVKIDGKNFPMWKALYIKKGSILFFGEMKSGLRGYIAIQGGLNIKDNLGSKSFDERGGLGLKIEDGTEIEIQDMADKSVIGREIEKNFLPCFDGTIRVITGPDRENFTEKSYNLFFSTDWKISHESNRMGIRLKGGRIEHSEKGANIESQGIVEGTIQVPPSGEPIILMKEHQTTGGYARIGVIVTCDLYKIAQRRPGESAKFKETTIKEAIQALREREKWLRGIKFKREGRRFIMIINGQRYRVEVERVE